MRRFSRDELAMAGVSPALMDSPGYVPVAAVLDEIDRFDAEFFGMSAQEAALLAFRALYFLLPLGLVAWAFVHASGIHATIAGVATPPSRRRTQRHMRPGPSSG